MGTHPGSSERIQKVLAKQGLGSRRELERCIAEGMVRVNGRIATLGDKIAPGDHIQFKGQKIKIKGEPLLPDVLLYHKPVGQICTLKDPQGRDSVYDHLPKCEHGRWVIVGRLDMNTSGLLLFTSCGELANKLMHPSFEVEREYAVRIYGELTAEQMRTLTREGVELEDGVAKLKSIKFQGGESRNHWYNIVLTEGRNREVRRIFEALDIQVSRLMRIRFGGVHLPPALKQGLSDLLPVREVRKLQSPPKSEPK